MKGLVAALATALAATATARAEPLRLRADALATTASPAGLLVLDSDAAMRTRDMSLRAEALVWVGDERGDVLVIALDARDRKNRVTARVGRFVSTLGALRAVHVDGTALRVALPHRWQLEGVAGVPVMPGLSSSRSFDWLAGARAARRLGSGGSVGLAYAQRRDAGQLVTEELGVDGGHAFSRTLDAAGRVAYDLARDGLAEVMLSTSHRDRETRVELYAIYRAASHLLPANSLFTVLGDVPSERAGTVVTWKAAPRLDVILDLGGRHVDSDTGVELAARARLRLDPRGRSLLGGELRRSGVGDDAWVGARGTARIALPRALTLATEVELVRPDVDRGHGTLWPWALVSLGWQRGSWQAAIAGEATSSAQYQYRLDVLAQLSRAWGGS